MFNTKVKEIADFKKRHAEKLTEVLSEVKELKLVIKKLGNERYEALDEIKDLKLRIKNFNNERVLYEATCDAIVAKKEAEYEKKYLHDLHVSLEESNKYIGLLTEELIGVIGKFADKDTNIDKDNSNNK